MTLEKSPQSSVRESSTSPCFKNDFQVPEILAPAGGRAQFFAALNAGADAVYLGLKEFNARGRAENFSLEDLSTLVPLARERGMKVLVTLNILLKEAELNRLIDDLSQLQWLGIEAVIVQDLGVARLVRECFPSIRLHASTQMAVHNRAGVLAAAKLGFRRVVMARELTAVELRKIRRDIPRELIEIEAFCHGSLCYSYSGLCFFSGAEDARSGNRGECAYTCRKPYKILSEPGHGFLFSMKDLNTSADLDKLVTAGIDTLKIEGRKKDAQYVATSVGLYRQKLNELFGRDTAPLPGLTRERDYQRDMAFSFHRDTTSFFVKGRYHENVIDLNNPTHKGLLIGKVARVQGRTVEFVTLVELERYDGLRIDAAESSYHAQPQHGSKVESKLIRAQRKYENEECQFSLRDFNVKQQRRTTASPGESISMQIPEDTLLPSVGDLIYKTRSNELKRHTESLTHPPEDGRLRSLSFCDVKVHSALRNEQLELSVEFKLHDQIILSTQQLFPAQRPQQSSRLEADLYELFALFGEASVKAQQLQISGDLNWFVAKSQLKQWKKQLSNQLPTALADRTLTSGQQAVHSLNLGRSARQTQKTAQHQIRIDRLEYLEAISQFLLQHPNFSLNELIFEPKRAFLGNCQLNEAMQRLEEFAAHSQAKIGLALPTVIRAWDEPQLRPWLRAFIDRGWLRFDLGNLGAIELLREAGCVLSEAELSSDFTLYALNSEAVMELAALGFQQISLSIEDDMSNIEAKLQRWPEQAEPVAILYKDTPLFIAEACSLTALHQGCPTAAVCGYRSLEIENEEGERFMVAHESCKSIVYGKEAYSITEHKKTLMTLGVRNFRIDLLTHPYQKKTIDTLLRALDQAQRVPSTHSANFTRELL